MEKVDILTQYKPEHIQFVDLYLGKGFNAATAYMKVFGCEYDSARSGASRLLATDNIIKLVEVKKMEMMEDLGIDFISQLKQLEFLKMKLIDDGKYKDAVVPLKVQNEMLGLNAPIKMDIKEEKVTIVINRDTPDGV